MMSILTRTMNSDGSTKEVIITRHGLTTKNKINSAYKLDDEVKHMVEKLENELEEKYQNKNKSLNVLNKYYFVGNKLKKFIDNLNLPKGEKQYIWQSINFHSKSLALSESNTRLTYFLFHILIAILKQLSNSLFNSESDNKVVIILCLMCISLRIIFISVLNHN